MIRITPGGVAAFCLSSVLFVGCGNKTEQATTTNANGKESSAPSGQQANQQKMALVRFVNAIPGGADDLWFGDNRAFTNVDYKSVTPYKELPGERHDFKLAGAGASAPSPDALSNNEGLSDGVHYTVVAMLDKDGKRKLDVITDRLTEPANGKSKLRVINASPVEVDVTSVTAMNGASAGTADRMKNPPPPMAGMGTGVDKWFGGVDSASSTNYKEIDPVSGNIEVIPTASVKRNRQMKSKPVTVGVDMAAGKFYTLIITSGKNGSGIDAVRVEDSLTGTPVASNAR